MTESLLKPSPTVVLKEMDDGGVLFCTRTEVYFGLNAVGVAVWDALVSGTESESSSFEDILGELENRYPDVDREVLTGDVADFLDALEGSELVIRISEQKGPGA